MSPFSESAGPYLGFFVCGGKLGFREISDQYSYKKQPSKIRHYVRKKTFSFPGGGNCPLRPPAMYGPEVAMKRADQGLIQITKMNAVRKNNMSSLLMRSQAMKKKFTVWKKKIMILNLIQRKLLT